MEDEAIIKLFFSRSERAVAELSEKYQKLCMKVAVNILGNMQDAEECVNDAYLGVWNTVPPQKPENLTAFLCKIVHLFRGCAIHRPSVIHYNQVQSRTVIRQMHKTQRANARRKENMENNTAKIWVEDIVIPTYRTAPPEKYPLFIEKRAYLKSCLEDMIRHGQERQAVWVKCGQESKKGHPHHPLYLKSSLPLEPFDVNAYIHNVL